MNNIDHKIKVVCPKCGNTTYVFFPEWVNVTEIQKMEKISFQCSKCGNSTMFNTTNTEIVI